SWEGAAEPVLGDRRQVTARPPSCRPHSAVRLYFPGCTCAPIICSAAHDSPPSTNPHTRLARHVCGPSLVKHLVQLTHLATMFPLYRFVALPKSFDSLYRVQLLYNRQVSLQNGSYLSSPQPHLLKSNV